MGRGVAAAACAVVVLSAIPARAEPSALDVCTASFEEAQLKQRRGKLVAARDLFSMCAADTCPKMLRDDCVARRVELDRALPTASFVVRDSNGKELDAKWTLDGEEFPSDGRAHAIDPGAHVVVYRVGGKASAEERIVIHEGEKSRVVPFTVRAVGMVTSEPPPSETPGSGYLVAPLVIGGIGAAALLTGVAMFFIANGEADKSDEFRKLENAARARGDLVNASGYKLAADSRDTAASADLIYAFIIGGSGLVLLGTGTLLYFMNKPSTKTSITPALGPGYAGVAFGTAF